MAGPSRRVWSLFSVLGIAAWIGATDYTGATSDDAICVGDVALLVGRIHYRGRESGVEMESAAGWVIRFRERRVVYFRAFRDPGEALGTVGLASDAPVS